MFPSWNLQRSALAATQPTPADHESMLRMITGCCVTQILHAVARFSIADELALRPATAAELATRCSLNLDATRRLLRACASLGLIAADSQQRFGSTPLLATLRSGSSGSLRELAMANASPGHWLPWSKFVEAIRTGSPQAFATLRKSRAEYYAQNPEESAHVAAATDALSLKLAQEVASLVDTRCASIAADIGGGGVALIQALLEANPHLHGILYDRPEAVAKPPLTARLLDLKGRLLIEAGDYISSVPRADLYLLKYVLHNWDDAMCIRILSNCRRSLRAGGRLLVIERQADDAEDAALGAVMDLSMLVLTGGRERTVPEYEALYAAAGMRWDKITFTPSSVAVMEVVSR